METAKQEAEVQAEKMDKRQVREVKSWKDPPRLVKREQAVQKRGDQGTAKEAQGETARQEAEVQAKKMDKRQAQERKSGKDLPRLVEREQAVREGRQQEEIQEEEAQ